MVAMAVLGQTRAGCSLSWSGIYTKSPGTYPGLSATPHNVAGQLQRSTGLLPEKRRFVNAVSFISIWRLLDKSGRLFKCDAAKGPESIHMDLPGLRPHQTDSGRSNIDKEAVSRKKQPEVFMTYRIMGSQYEPRNVD